MGWWGTILFDLLAPIVLPFCLGAISLVNPQQPDYLATHIDSRQRSIRSGCSAT